MKYSIVTVCYNAAKDIEQTMQSILNQTCSRELFEYIVVDGASTDNTFALVQANRTKFEEKGIAFRCYSAPDKGISDAFNKGIGYAKGEWVALVNAGDRYAADALATFEQCGIDENDICFGNVLWCNRETGLSYLRRSSPSIQRLALSMPIMHPACIIRKSAYDEVGLYCLNFRYAMDRELLARMYRAGKRFRYIDHVFSEMSVGGLSDTGAYSRERRQESRSIALACGISPLHFEYVYQSAKCRFLLTQVVKHCPWLNRLLVRHLKR